MLPAKTAAALREHLDAWWLTNGRKYPWRDTRDPYRVLVAELMLHRTKADQVASVYQRFLDRYPTAKSLSETSSAEILRILRPLGLHWRSRLVADLFSEVNSRMGGRVPVSAPVLRKLPGVSDYISGAVVCFTRDEPVVILDTNIVRVLGRVSGSRTSDASRRSLRFRVFLRSLLPGSSVRRFYFALLDLAALVCLPHGPLCNQCPVAPECTYARVRLNASTPVRLQMASQVPPVSRLVTQDAGSTRAARSRQRLSIASRAGMDAGRSD